MASAAEYDVQEAVIKKELPATGQRGPLHVWELVLKAADGEIIKCERNKKPQNLIRVGDKVYGYIEERENFPPVLKEVQRPGDQNGAEGSPSSSKDDFERRPDHILNVQRARHSTALQAAPDYYRLMAEVGVIKPPPADMENRKVAMLEQLQGLITWLEGTYPRDPRDEVAG